MKISTDVESILPIQVPDKVSVLLRTSCKSFCTFDVKLSDFDPEQLHSICDQFKKDVFKAAGKPLTPRGMT